MRLQKREPRVLLELHLVRRKLVLVAVEYPVRVLLWLATSTFNVLLRSAPLESSAAKSASPIWVIVVLLLFVWEWPSVLVLAVSSRLTRDWIHMSAFVASLPYILRILFVLDHGRLLLRSHYLIGDVGQLRMSLSFDRLSHLVLALSRTLARRKRYF